MTLGKPDAGKPPVRFDEGRSETVIGPSASSTRPLRLLYLVRGADLLKSTARQILLYRALGFQPPAFFHCPLMNDESGVRLAKRHDALSLRTLRERGESPEELRRVWTQAGSQELIRPG